MRILCKTYYINAQEKFRETFVMTHTFRAIERGGMLSVYTVFDSRFAKRDLVYHQYEIE